MAWGRWFLAFGFSLPPFDADDLLFVPCGKYQILRFQISSVRGSEFAICDLRCRTNSQRQLRASIDRIQNDYPYLTYNMTERGQNNSPGASKTRRAFLLLLPLGFLTGALTSLAAASFRFLRPRITLASDKWIDVAPV